MSTDFDRHCEVVKSHRNGGTPNCSLGLTEPLAGYDSNKISAVPILNKTSALALQPINVLALSEVASSVARDDSASLESEGLELPPSAKEVNMVRSPVNKIPGTVNGKTRELSTLGNIKENCEEEISKSVGNARSDSDLEESANKLNGVAEIEISRDLYPNIGDSGLCATSMTGTKQLTFHRTNQLDFCEKGILKIVWKHKDAWPFYKPVDPVALNIPDYFDIITQPMDFGTIRKKLKDNAYETAEHCLEDFRLTFENCKRYNPPSSDIVRMCENVESLFLQRASMLPKEVFVLHSTTAPVRPIKRKSIVKNRKLLNGGPASHTTDDQSVTASSDHATACLTSPPPTGFPQREPLKRERYKKTPVRSKNDIKYLGINDSIWTPDQPLFERPNTRKRSVGLSEHRLSVTENLKKVVEGKADPCKHLAALPKLNISKGKLSTRLQFCKKLLQKLFSRKYRDFAWPFYTAVDAESLQLPDYHTVIKKPMDLSLIKSKLENKQYSTPREFESDMNLVFRNCRRYNPPDSEIYQMCRKLQDVFEEGYALLPDESDVESGTSLDSHSKPDGKSSGKLNGHSSSINNTQNIDIIGQRDVAEKLEKLQEVVLSLQKQVTGATIASPEGVKKRLFTKTRRSMGKSFSGGRWSGKTSGQRPDPVKHKQVSQFKKKESVKPSKKRLKNSPLDEVINKKHKKEATLPMTLSEQRELGNNIRSLTREEIKPLLKIIRDQIPRLTGGEESKREEVQIDIASLDAATLRRLDGYVKSVIASKSKSQLGSVYSKAEAQRLRRGDSSDSSGLSTSDSGLSDSSTSDIFSDSDDDFTTKSNEDLVEQKKEPEEPFMSGLANGVGAKTKLVSGEQPAKLINKLSETPLLSPCTVLSPTNKGELAGFQLPAPTTDLSKKVVKLSNASAWGSLANVDVSGRPSCNSNGRSEGPRPVMDDLFAEYKSKAIESFQKAEDIKRRERLEVEERLKAQVQQKLEEEKREKHIKLEKLREEEELRIKTEKERSEREAAKQRRREEERKRRQDELSTLEQDDLHKAFDLETAFD